MPLLEPAQVTSAGDAVPAAEVKAPYQIVFEPYPETHAQYEKV